MSQLYRNVGNPPRTAKLRTVKNSSHSGLAPTVLSPAHHTADLTSAVPAHHGIEVATIINGAGAESRDITLATAAASSRKVARQPLTPRHGKPSAATAAWESTLLAALPARELIALKEGKVSPFPFFLILHSTDSTDTPSLRLRRMVCRYRGSLSSLLFRGLCPGGRGWCHRP